MNDINEAFEADNGFTVIDGPFITGGVSSPVGLDLPENTIYYQETSIGVKTWQKYGSDTTNWAVKDNLVRRTPIEGVFYIPSDTSIILSDRRMDGQLYVDGEVFVI